MVNYVTNIVRQTLLFVTVLVAVVAFFPDTAHLAAQNLGHEISDPDHDHTPGFEKDKNHCHSGVTCTGGMNAHGWQIASSIGSPLAKLKFEVAANNDGHVLGRDPPVPILVA